MSETPNYKHTMNLPKTSFKMKAGLPQHAAGPDSFGASPLLLSRAP